MINGVIDVGVCEVEDVYVCFLKDGGVVNIFVGFKFCFDVKVLGIIEVVNSVMIDVCENWKEKVVVLGFNGVFVMVGNMGGVYVLLKWNIFYLIKVYCIVYLLEFVFLDIVKVVL